MAITISFDFDDMPNEDAVDLARYLLTVGQHIKMVGDPVHALYPALKLGRFADSFPGCHGFSVHRDGEQVRGA